MGASSRTIPSLRRMKKPVTVGAMHWVLAGKGDAEWGQEEDRD